MTREDAIEIIRKNMPSDKSLPVYEALQTLVPELAESEDERIRKGLIDNNCQIPSDIDEAAEEYAYNNWEDNDYHTGASEGLPFDAIGHTEKCFKAGAKWMAGQGETIFDTIDVDGQGQRWLTDNLLLGDYDYGEEVIVQIRKKH